MRGGRRGAGQEAFVRFGADRAQAETIQQTLREKIPQSP
jgi:hypothetical protein